MSDLDKDPVAVESAFEVVEPARTNDGLKMDGKCACSNGGSCPQHHQLRKFVDAAEIAAVGQDLLANGKLQRNGAGEILCYKSADGWVPDVRDSSRSEYTIRMIISQRIREATPEGALFRGDEHSREILNRFADAAGDFPPNPEFATGSKLVVTAHENGADRHGRFPHNPQDKFSHLRVSRAPKVIVPKRPDLQTLARLNSEPLAFRSFPTDVQTLAIYDPETKLWKAQVLPAGELAADHWERMYHYPDGFITGMIFYQDEEGIYGFRIDKHIERACSDAKRRDFIGVTPEFLKKLFVEQLSGDKRWVPQVGNEAGNRYYGRFIGYPTNSAPPLRGKEKEMLFLGTPVGPYRNDQMLRIKQLGPRPVVRGFGNVKSPMNYAGPVGEFAPHQDAKYHEAMFMANTEHDGKRVQEGTSVNFAFVKHFAGGKPMIMIPSLGHGDILPGITMKSVVELAQHHGYEICHQDVYYEDIEDADEILVTGTAMSVRGVEMMDDVDGEVIFQSKFGGNMGPVASQMAKDFQLILQRKHPNPELNAWMQKIA